MSAVPGGATRLGPTPPGATRRTTTLVVAPHRDWSSGQRVSALGRDLVRTLDGGARTTHAAFTFDVDARGRIAAETSGAGLPVQLHGQPAQHGLRKRMAALRAGDLGDDVLGPEGGLYDAMLDDVVGTTVASGYGRLYEGSTGQSGGEISSHLRMTCVGFNTLHARGEEFDVQQYFERKPPSVEFVPDDTRAWHDDAAMQPNTFRRRRMLQVAPRPDGAVDVTGYFRDTFMRPDGAEMVVHEYGLDARASGTPLVLERVEAVPGNLPLDHCPLAARSALDLVGLPLSEVEETVRRELAGPGGCTHLNDELRALRLVRALLDPVTR